MSVVQKALIMMAIVTLSHVSFYSASVQSNVYIAKNNIRFTRTYLELTNVQLLKCLSECDKDFLCLSVNYHHGIKKCALTSFRHDDKIDWSVDENGWKLYYQKNHDARFVSGIQAWESSVAGDYLMPGSLTIDRKFLSRFGDNSCFHSEHAVDHFIIVELNRVTSVAYIDVLFRSDCCNLRNRNIKIIVSETKEDANINKGAVCAFYNGPPMDPTIPERIQCAANSIGKFVKFLQHNIQRDALHICEIAFYSK